MKIFIENLLSNIIESNLIKIELFLITIINVISKKKKIYIYINVLTTISIFSKNLIKMKYFLMYLDDIIYRRFSHELFHVISCLKFFSCRNNDLSLKGKLF